MSSHPASSILAHAIAAIRRTLAANRAFTRGSRLDREERDARDVVRVLQFVAAVRENSRIT